VAELEVPRGDAPVAHLATPQWQSFEIRMRARKADRCLQRAAAALDSGSAGDASIALEEARQLSPSDPRLEELSARLDALKYPALPLATGRGHSYFWTSAAVLAGLVVASAAGWETWIHRDHIALLIPKARPDMDVSAGLAPPTAVSSAATDAKQAAAAASDSATAREPQTSASADTVVQTTLIRPDQVIDTRDTPPQPGTQTETPSVSTSGTAERSDINTEAAKPVATTNAPETPVRPQRDIAPSPQPSPDYRTPAPVPPPPNVAPATNVIPSVTPPSDPPRPANATNAMLTAPASTPAPDAVTSPATVVPTPLPPAAAPSTSSVDSPSARDERVAIRAALNRYESAYNRLDVDAVRTVWPSLDQRALARAFESLTAQRVALQTCNVDVSGSTARANCSGNASWTPKIGGGEQRASRKWTFDLSESNGAWRITHVQAR
jgi:hypothetical protein